MAKKRPSKKPNNGRNKPRSTGNYPGDKTYKTEDKPTISSGNPPEIYKATPELAEIAARVNTNNPLGTPYAVFRNPDIGTGPGQIPVRYASLYEPGVAVLNYHPGPGPSNGPNSPVNLAMNHLFSKMRAATSAYPVYDAASVGLYVLAMDSAFMWYSILKRLYGTLVAYSGMNRYLPYVLVRGQGFNFEDCQSHMNDLLFRINRYARVISRFNVPNLRIFDRHQWCCENSFYDEEGSDKAQIYITKPLGLYFLHETGSGDDKRALLDYVPWTKLYAGSSAAQDGPALLEYSQIDNICTKFENIFFFSSDVAIISADMAKAFDGSIRELSLIDEGFERWPVYDDMILHMIHNASLMGQTVCRPIAAMKIQQQFESTDVYNWLSYTPLYENLKDRVPHKQFRDLYDGNRLLDFRVPNPSTDLVMESTRFVTMRSVGSEWYFGTEIAVSIDILSYRATTAGSITTPEVMSTQLTITSGMSGYWANTSKASAFNMFPFTSWMDGGVDQGQTEWTMRYFYTWFDVDNYTVLEPEQMRKIHEAAILSEWSIDKV